MLTLSNYDCADDLSQYVDSLLFADDEVVVNADFTDKNDVNINMRIIVTGEVAVVYKGETYNDPDDFPEELRERIRCGDVMYYESEDASDAYIESGNYFLLVYTITDAKGEEIVYDGVAFETDLSKMTADSLEDYLAEYADNLYTECAAEIANAAKTKTKSEHDER